ncbi:MAG: hypothetical protein HQ579_07335 [Candidatus Omnitrophica bacterium]|nr:hypothetical protein [Candidatus Omnitrophota bacterium]
MKRIAIIIVTLALMLSSVPAFAAEGGTKSPSKKAYKHANEKAAFKRSGDQLAAKKEAKKAKREAREAKREVKKAKKAERKAHHEEKKALKKKAKKE